MNVFNLTSKPGHGPGVFRLWFNPSGRRLLILTGGHGSGANRLWNWDVPNRRPLGHRTVITDIDHHNCHPFPTFDRTLRYMVFDEHVENRKTGKRVNLEYINSERIISPDARKVYAEGYNDLINQYDLEWKIEGDSTIARYDKLKSYTLPDNVYVESLAVSSSGNLLVVLTLNGKTLDGMRLLSFRVPDGPPFEPIEFPSYETDGVRMMMEPYGRMLFSPDDRTVAIAGDGVFLANPLGEQPVRTLDERHFADIAFTPDGSLLFGVRPDGTTVQWDVASGAAITSYDFSAEAGDLKAVAVAPDGLTVIAGGSMGRLVQWDI